MSAIHPMRGFRVGSTMAGDATAPCTTKLRLFAKRRRWEVAMHVQHQSDARLSCRVNDSRRNHQTCDGAVAAMINNRDIRFKKAQNWVGLYPTLKRHHCVCDNGLGDGSRRRVTTNK